MTEHIELMTDFAEAWFMLDLPEMKRFIISYADHFAQTPKKARLSIDDWFQIWKQKVRDEGQCRECRIG